MKLLHLLALAGASAALSQGNEVDIDILKDETNSIQEHPSITMVDPEVVEHDPDMVDSVEEVSDVADRDLLFGFLKKTNGFLKKTNELLDKPKKPSEPTTVFQLHYYGQTSGMVKSIFANVSKILNSVIKTRSTFRLHRHLFPRDQCRIAKLPGYAFKPQTLNSIPLFIGAGKSDGVGGSVARTRLCLTYRTKDHNTRTALAAIFYDPADVNDEADPEQIQQILLHEAIHALGFGYSWDDFLYRKSGNYWYAGKNAVYEYRRLLPINDKNRITGLLPLENDPLSGSQGVHWQSSVFGDELMTSFFRGERHILSRLTAKAIEDLGYSIDYNSSFIENYTIPTAEEMENIREGRDRNSNIRGSESDST